MDLYIKKDGQSKTLSSLGLYNITVEDSSPTVESSRRTVRGRNGYIFDGLTYSEKTITVTARLKVNTIADFLLFKDKLNAWVLGDDSFYIELLYDSEPALYDFELPGQKTGELKPPRSYGSFDRLWNVISHGEIEYEFIGNSSAGLKYNLSFSFVTAGLPFAESSPTNLNLTTNNFSYVGTAPLSQLEVPFVVELTANADNTDFFLEIDGRRFTYRHVETPIRSGQKLLLRGIETVLVDGNREINVNNRTNFEYFVIRPKFDNRVTWFTSFKGTIRILGFKNLYK